MSKCLLEQLMSMQVTSAMTPAQARHRYRHFVMATKGPPALDEGVNVRRHRAALAGHLSICVRPHEASRSPQLEESNLQYCGRDTLLAEL